MLLFYLLVTAQVVADFSCTDD